MPAPSQLVMVVDDDRDIRKLVVELLELDGFQACTASSGVDALDKLGRIVADREATAPDLVLLDVQMPEMDGWDTLRRIRRLDGLGAVPVVLCTVKASPVDLELGWNIGCDGYLAKPFAIDELTATVRTVLARTPDDRVNHRLAQLLELHEPGP